MYFNRFDVAILQINIITTKLYFNYFQKSACPNSPELKNAKDF